MELAEHLVNVILNETVKWPDSRSSEEVVKTIIEKQLEEGAEPENEMGTGMDEDAIVFEPSQYDHWFGFPPEADTPLLPLENQPCNATPSVAPLAPLTDVGERNDAKQRECTSE